MKTQKNIASIMVLWTTSGVSETAKVFKHFIKFDFCELNTLPSEQLYESGTGVNGYVKISIASIFSSKERHKRLPNRSRKKQTAKTFPLGSLNFFFPIQFQMFAFSVLQFFPRIFLVVLWIYWDVSCIY